MREDLEKLVVRSTFNLKYFFIKALNIILIFCVTNQLKAQNGFIKGKKYEIDSIIVSGLKTFNQKTVVSYSGLRKGQIIQVPGDEITATINKLWKLELFSDINFYVSSIKNNKVILEIEIEELPTLSDIKIKGIKKSKAETIINDTELNKGKKLSKSFLTNTRNYIINKFKKEGFLNVKVNLNTIPDSTGKNNLKMLINIDRGDRIKINSIDFTGNQVYSNFKLKRKLKNTKQKLFGRFWKKSKFIDEDFIEDKEKLIDFFKEKGYRDARIVSDSTIINDNKSLTLKINIEEGRRYYFGDIKFIGNSVYNNFQLQQILGIKKGDPYNGVLLKKQIANDKKPDGNDLTNLYQNNGYLFSSINAVEVSAEEDTINYEIRINEGKLAQFNKISVVGNTKTNDRVIYREIRTKPGELYSKDKVVRTVRELGQLGFFDAEQISPDFKNVDPNSGTVDIEYGLVEAGASQVEIQGGYGGGGFIGSFGFAVNNFSIQNIKNKKAWTPFPMGDGQTLSLRLQATQFYNAYSFSFIEPWLGGRQPFQFSTSFSHTTQYRYDYFTGRADKSQYMQISGMSVGIAKRLSVPDDYFTLSQVIQFQYFDLKNYYTGLFTFGDGKANNLNYTIALSRNNTFTNPIFPVGGSTFTLSGKFTLPYSLITGEDFSSLSSNPFYQLPDGEPDVQKIDQEKFSWLEFYKIKFNGTWYTRIIDKLVLKTQTDFGFLGAYNTDRGNIPFERFYVGGDGMNQTFAMDGREVIALRGYPNQSLSTRDGSLLYNKFTAELRYPITLKPSASIFALTFLESGNGYDSFRNFNPFESKRSAGMGIRIFMPAFGLLGIDFAHGFDSIIPGQTSPNGWETHFIIGQNF